jgi:hypothetical protein
MVFKTLETIGFELSTAVVRASSGGPSRGQRFVLGAGIHVDSRVSIRFLYFKSFEAVEIE